MTINTGRKSEEYPNAQAMHLEVTPKSKTSKFKSFFTSISSSSKSDPLIQEVAHAAIPRTNSDTRLSPRSEMLQESTVSEDWRECVFGSINPKCEIYFKAYFNNEIVGSLEAFNKLSQKLFSYVYDELILNFSGIHILLNQLTQASEPLPSDSELKTTLELFTNLDVMSLKPSTLLWKFNLRYRSLCENFSPKIRSIVFDIFGSPATFHKAEIMASEEFTERVLLDIKVWLNNKIFPEEIRYTIDNFQTASTKPLVYKQAFNLAKKDPRLNYPSAILRGLVAEGGQIHPNRIDIMGQSLFSDSTFEFRDEDQSYALKRGIPRKFVLRPIIQYLSKILRCIPLTRAKAHLLTIKFESFEKNEPNIQEKKCVERIFKESDATYILDDDPDTREIEIREIKREILYSLRVKYLFEEYPELKVLGLLTVGAFGPIRDIQNKHFPFSCHSHHSIDPEGFITTTDKSVGTHFFLDVETPSDGSADRLIVRQSKKLILNYVRVAKEAFSSSIGDENPVSFTVNWEIDAKTGIEEPLEGIATFSEISINSKLPVEEQQRIARLFLL